MCDGDDCQLQKLDRRAFLLGATTAAASVGLTGLHTEIEAKQSQQQRPQNQQQNPPVTRVLDDPAIQHGKVVFKHNGAETIDGYLARPKAQGKYPAVLVIAGNVITEEYIPNTCAALAKAGFVGLAPNIFHTLPASAETPEERRKALAGHTDYDALLDIESGIDFLRTESFVKQGGMGVVGFCYGGRLAMLLGARLREVDAVVPYHPGPVTVTEISRLKSPVQIHCGTADRNVSVASIQALDKNLRAQSTPVETFFYAGADHGFLAYTRPYYKPDAAVLSWQRTVRFLKRYLG